MEDNLMRYYLECISDTEAVIAILQADIEALAQHPHPEGGFAGITVNGTAYTSRTKAGAALLDACADITENIYTEICSYRGFVLFAAFTGFQHVLTLKNATNHRVELGEDPRGNLTRIDNVLAEIPERLESQKARLADLHRQLESARAEAAKPFAMEVELQRESTRLAELDAALNLGHRDGAEAAA